MKRILVLGYFGYKLDELNGQTSKTRNVYNMIVSKNEDKNDIRYFDTQQFQYSKFSIFTMIKRIIMCDKLVYIPAHNNLKYLFPIIYLICWVRRSEILLIVVGGWMDTFIKSKKLHAFLLSKIGGIFPQSHRLRERLIAQFRFTNVHYFPNFRINSFVPSFKQRDDFRIVFMARIMRQKGIDTIFQLADNISHQSKIKNRISIDFYGPISEEDEEYFVAQVEKYEMVTYQGILLPDDIYKTLNEYDLMVLPTRFFTEGFPGTILDAYMSGIPAVATRWENATEFIDDNITGYIVPFENCEKEFIDAVMKLYENRDILLTMKQNAYHKSKLFSSDSAWEILKIHIDN